MSGEQLKCLSRLESGESGLTQSLASRRRRSSSNRRRRKQLVMRQCDVSRFEYMYNSSTYLCGDKTTRSADLFLCRLGPWEQDLRRRRMTEGGAE